MSQLRRLLIVSEPGQNGVFHIVTALIQHLHAKHPDVVLDWAYSTRRRGAELAAAVQRVEDHGGETVDLDVGNAPEPRDLAAAFKIVSLVTRRRHQMVHAHSSKAGALCRLLSVVPGFPKVIYSPHAYLGLSRRGGKREHFYNFLESAFGHLSMTQNCSAGERRFAIDVLGLPPRSVVLVNNGVDTDDFALVSPEEKQRLRKELGIPTEGKLLITIGRHTVQKNYLVLYDALSPFLGSPNPDFFFAHAGTGAGELCARLSPSAAANCHPFEHLTDTRPLVQAADGFIMTSLYEGQSIAMLHALSCGLQMILPRSPGIAGLASLGFDDIQWLPAPAAGVDLKPSIMAALQEWSRSEPRVLSNQRERTCSKFNETTQLSKVIRLYEWLLRNQRA